MLRSSTGPREAESTFLSLNYFGLPNKALFFPYNKQTSSFGLFHIYAWVRVVPCINVCASALAICVRLTDRLREPEMSAVVEAALALLSNLIYDCPENIHKLRKMDGTVDLPTFTPIKTCD